MIFLKTACAGRLKTMANRQRPRIHNHSNTAQQHAAAAKRRAARISELIMSVFFLNIIMVIGIASVAALGAMWLMEPDL